MTPLLEQIRRNGKQISPAVLEQQHQLDTRKERSSMKEGCNRTKGARFELLININFLKLDFHSAATV